MNKQACAIGIIVILAVAVGVVFILGMDPPSGNPPFDNEGRLTQQFSITWV